MKGKFSSMGRVAIALVLALSLSLVTALPVAAGAPGVVLTTPGAGIDSISGTPTGSGTEAGVHTIVVTDATQSVLHGLDAEHLTLPDMMANDLVGDETLSLTIAGESITTEVLAPAVAGSTLLTTVASDIQAKINAKTSNTAVTVSVEGISPNKNFLITVDEAGLANSITTQVTGANGGDTETGLGGQSPVAGTDAEAVDTFAAANGSNGLWFDANGTTLTVTHSPAAGTASSLAGLEALVEAAGAFINGVTLDASAALTAGTAVVTVSAGTAGYFVVTGTATMTAGDSNELTITAYDDADNLATAYAGSHDLTFSGLATAPDATVPTVEGTNVGTATAVTFTAGVSNSNAATLLAYCAEDTTVHVSEGAINSTGHGLALTVDYAAVATLTVQAEPTATVAGEEINDVTVKVEDAFGNPIDGVSIAVTETGHSYTFDAGTTPRSTVGTGIATFDDLVINTADTGYQLHFAGGGQTDDSITFDVTAAAVATLTVQAEPTATVAGEEINDVTVLAEDAFSNPVEGVSIAVTETGHSYTFDAGTLSQATVGTGIATFDDLVINTADTSYTLHFAGGGQTDDSITFDVTADAFAGYTVVPAAGPYEAGTAFDVTITAVDGFDNPVGTAYVTAEPYTWVTTASDAPDTTSPVIGTLAAVDFTAGVATKSVTLYAAESGVTFSVTDGSTATGTSAGITVVPAAVNTLTVEEQPTAAVAGVAITPAVEVKAVDEYGNVIEGESIAASLLVGAGALSGTTPQLTDAAGIATFDDLSIDLVGADKQLQFTADTVTVNSDVFAITVGAVATLTVVAEPTGTVAGVAISPVTVLAEDAFSNPVEGVSIAVTEAGAYTFDAGTLSQATGVDGIATFADLVINTAAVDYQLHFAAGAVTVDSALFDVLPAQADSFVFDAIVTQDAGVAFAITITAIDVYGNTDTGYAGPATLSDLTGTIDPGVTGAFIDGVWTDNVTILLAYTANTITATDALVTGTSDPFDVAPYPVYNTTTGQGYLTIQAAIDDASSGNTITVGPGTYVGDITISETLTLVSSGGPTVTKLTGTGAGPVVTIDDFNVTVDGFEIDPGTDGIFIDTISAGNVVTIQNQVIYDNTEQGIDVGEVYGTLNVFDCIIAANASEGVYIDLVDDGGVVVMTGNKIGAWTDTDYDLAGNGNEGVYIDFVNDGSTVTIGGATTAEANFICDNSSYGIDVYMVYYGSTLTIEGNVIGSYAPGGFTLAGNGSYGVYVEYVDFGSDLTITGNTINDNSGDGIYIDEVGWDGSDPATEAEYYALFQTYGANNVTIEGNTACRNDCEGIYVYYMEFASTLTIQDNTLSDNYCDGMYIAYYGGDSGTFYDNPATYPAYFGPVVLVKGNTITDNEDYGIYCDEYSYGTSVTIEDNLISGNWDGGIYHCCGPEYGSTVTIRGNTIVSNDTDENGYGNIYMSDYIEYGSTYIVEDNFIAGSTYYGVYISYVDYDSTLIIRGNTIGAGTDAQGNAYAGNYYEAVYIDYVEYDSTVEITRNDICGNEDDAIYIYEIYDNSSVSVTCNNICDNYYYALEVDYLYDDGSSLNVHYNNISGNDDGIYHNDYGSDYVPVNATHNWWGDASGPYESSYNPDGLGDEVSDLVIFSPWLTSPSVCQVRTTLAAGWNTLSTPIALDSASDELAELGLDMAQAYAYSGGIWVLVTTANDNLEACGAFYVNMNSPAIIDFVPSAEITDPTTRTLPAGWSLVSMANLGSMTASEAMQTAFLVTGDLTGYAQVVSPAVNQPSWAFLRGGSSPPDMVPCKGYWLFMNNAGKLAGFTSTPIDLH